MPKTTQAPLWRAWLSTGRYVLVRGADEAEARRNLTQGQREKLTRLRPVHREEG